VSFSPDGQTIATASLDNTARLWSRNGQQLSELKGHLGFVLSVSFSPDGQTIATASDDNTARLWLVRDLPGLLAQGCNWLNDYLVTHGTNLATLEVCQTASNRLAAVPFLVKDGEEQARAGNLDTAITTFQTALKWNPNLNFDPATKAKNLADAASLVEKGVELAQQSKLEEATAQFQNALKLDPSLDFEPQTKAGELAASTLVSQGEQLAGEGKIQEAVAQFQSALKLNPRLDFQPQTKAQQVAASALVEKGKNLAIEGKVKEAIEAYAQAQDLDKIPGDDWNQLCWYGSLREHAVDVMYACENAVKLAPENGSTWDSRGLAKALTGDLKGAIADFETAIKLITDDDTRLQRLRWLDALRNEQNPFAKEVLKKLLDE
jgi:tetratricopeptide (TPR) repeat protein